MTNTTYLTKLKERELEKEIKDCAAFGIMTCGILMLVSGWFYFFTVSDYHNIWSWVFKISVLMFICGVIIPQILYYPQKIVAGIGNFIFLIFFRLLLAVVYVLTILPISLIHRKSKINPEADDWTDKVFDYSISESDKYHHNKLISCLSVIKFFINKKQWFLIPTIVILLVLGLVFAFIQSSIVLPFIYSIL